MMGLREDLTPLPVWSPAVLFYDRTASIDAVAARSGYAAVLRPGLRGYVVRAEGVRFDTAVHPGFFDRVAPDAPGKLSIVLSGELVLRSTNGAEVLVRPGEFHMHGQGWSERWEGSTFRVVVLEWHETFGGKGSFSRGSFSAADRARLEGLADRLELGLESGAEAAEWAARLAAILRAAGAPLEPMTPRDLDHDMPAGIVPVARAVTTALRDVRQRPSWVDVEEALGKDARSLRRDAARFAPWLAPLGFPREWRRTTRKLRMVGALRFLGAARATLEDVASATGYGSARALILALHQEGFPTPGTIRAFYRGQSV